jgi:glutamate N-acetyltransferase/amino-acid N-acetyltransferase
VVQLGGAASYDEAAARSVMAASEVTITIDLHLGEAEATAWGCDLTHGYIDENTLYTR